MIKIQIKDKRSFKNEYLKIVKDLVLDDLNLLTLSISHLSDPNTIKDEDITTVSTLTKNIVNIIRSSKLKRSFFNKSVYKTAINTYSNNVNIKNTNWRSLIRFIDLLLDLKNDNLQTLLTGDPSQIKNFNDLLLNPFKFEVHEIEILKFGFKYNGDAGKKVRDFFYKKSLTTFCPYCNLELALNTKNKNTGAIANQLNLDHFFDKDSNPLLSLSLFNLIPCDTTCNLTNKYTKKFSDQFHLNPYISGLKRDFVFEPVFIKDIVTEIKLKINAKRTSERYFQLIGDADHIDETPLNGNLNVFQIYSKYNQHYIYQELNWLAKDLLNVVRGVRSINKFLTTMGNKNTEISFVNWYETNAKSKFYEKEFGHHAKSKLNRDLLDHIVSNYSRHSEDLQFHDLLENSYKPNIGGE